MDYAHQKAPQGEERRHSARIDAILRFNYQVISESESKLDPYNPEFMLPRYFQLLAELKQIDSVISWEIDNVKTEQPSLGHILGLLNQKLDLMNTTSYESIQAFLPSPEKVNVSESGLSFFTYSPLHSNAYIHISLSHPENMFHIATTAHVVYCLEQPNRTYRVGAHFISIHQKDRLKLAECVRNQLIAG